MANLAAPPSEAISWAKSRNAPEACSLIYGESVSWPKGYLMLTRGRGALAVVVSYALSKRGQITANRFF